MLYVPVPRGGDEVETGVHPGVGHDRATDPRLRVEVLLVLAVDVVCDWLPAVHKVSQGQFCIEN